MIFFWIRLGTEKNAFLQVPSYERFPVLLWAKRSISVKVCRFQDEWKKVQSQLAVIENNRLLDMVARGPIFQHLRNMYDIANELVSYHNETVNTIAPYLSRLL